MNVRGSGRFVLLVSGLLCHSVEARHFQIGADFISALPREEFRSNLEDNGYGFAVHAAYNFPESPVVVGAQLGYVKYGTERRRVPLSGSIPDIALRVNTTNNIILTHLFLRLQRQAGRLRPYVEGLLGFHYLFTQTSVRTENFAEPLASSTNLSDFALSYGPGLGLQLKLYESQTGSPVEILLDMKMRYLRGSEAEYLKKGGIRRENGRAILLVQESRTDMLLPQLGLTVRF